MSNSRAARIFEMLSGALFGLGLTAFTMTEFGLESLFGGWRPTYEVAISCGVLSTASVLISMLYHYKNRL